MVLKPDAATSTLYIPGSTASSRYEPSPRETVSRTTFVALLVTLTDAPAMTAPTGSVIVPTIMPLLDCAQTIELKAHSNIIVRTTTNLALYIIPPSYLRLINIGIISKISYAENHLCCCKCYSKYGMSLHILRKAVCLITKHSKSRELANGSLKKAANATIGEFG